MVFTIYIDDWLLDWFHDRYIKILFKVFFNQIILRIFNPIVDQFFYRQVCSFIRLDLQVFVIMIDLKLMTKYTETLVSSRRIPKPEKTAGYRSWQNVRITKPRNMAGYLVWLCIRPGLRLRSRYPATGYRSWLVFWAKLGI